MRIYIRAMSDERREIRRDLVHASEQVVTHLIKLMIFPNAEYHNHWESEIHSFLHKVSKVKGKNKWPDYKFIKEAISTHNDMIPEFIQIVIDEEDQLTAYDDIDISAVEKVIETYCVWLATQLSTKGFVIKSEVISELESII